MAKEYIKRDCHSLMLCDKCDGNGFVEIRECTDYHKVEYSYERKECTRCKGSGRLIVTENVTVRPYSEKEYIEVRKPCGGFL